MKKLLFIAVFISIFFSSILFAENTGRVINNKCRANLKILNAATSKMLSQHDFVLPKWSTYKQAISNFLKPEKYLDDKEIVGPTPDCQYYLVSDEKNDFQWLCYLHGVLEGNQNLTLKYHEHVLQGKKNDKYMTNEDYKTHFQYMLHWTEYTLTPVEYFKYHYNMNPIITTVLGIIFLIASYLALKSFFGF